MRIGALPLAPGQYFFGWTRGQDVLKVSFYEAETGRLLGEVDARREPSIHRVESFRIWPPGDRSVFQLGRFTMEYALLP